MKITKFAKPIIKNIKKYDKSYKSKFEFLLYPGFKALMYYYFSHKLYLKKHYFLARHLQNKARKKTGIEIHPGATIGRGLVIDHGMGVVIGETAIVGDDVLMYHRVTLGASKQVSGKRHPSIGNNVVLGCNSTILGNISVGDNTKIGANSLVTKSVGPNKVMLSPLAVDLETLDSKKRVYDEKKIILGDEYYDSFKRYWINR